MAAKKTKKVDEEKASTSETKKSTKKTTAKKDKKIQITFNPQFSAAESKTILLSETDTVVNGNHVRRKQVPAIEGLPTVLTIKKGEIYEVTHEQFKILYEMGYIDTPEDIAERKKARNAINTQVGVNPREYKMSNSLAHLYDDNFVLVE